MLEEIIETLAPFLIEGIAAVLGMLISWATVRLTQKWKLEATLINRTVLDQALARIVAGAFEKKLDKAAATEVALSYLKSTIPAALRKLGVTDAQLRDRISLEITNWASRQLS